MKIKENIKKLNIAEMRLYEFLGIKLFRKSILLFEHIRHIRDNKRNENYHLQSTSDSSLLRFSGYLFYNAAFHAVSLLFIIIYFTATRCLSMQNIVVDIVVAITVVFDIYCLILQRYIQLRFQQHIDKRQQKKSKSKASRISHTETLLKDKSSEMISREIAFLQEMKADILSGKDIILTADNEDVLLGIAEVCDRNPDCKTTKKEKTPNKMTFMELLNSVPYETRVITSKQRCVAALQKLLNFPPKNNVMFGVCIVAQSPAVASAYRKIFPDLALDSILETTDILLDAYCIRQKEVVKR